MKETLPERAILPLYYLAPVQYFTKFLLHKECYIEQAGNYNRQGYQNRCIILSANGPLALSIPVLGGTHPGTPYRNVQIAYFKRWNNIHWKAIESAYRNAPFFEYYADAFLPVYEKEFPSLWDFNLHLLITTLTLLEIPWQPTFTDSWKPTYTDAADYRTLMHPKAARSHFDPDFHPVPYYQVFGSRFGFVANLSILDLIFNEGPESLEILRRSIAQG